MLHRMLEARGGTLIVASAMVAVAAVATAAGTERRWAAEAHLGGAWSLPLPLAVRQPGHDDLRFRARWDTRALDPPLYYVARLATRRGERGWALDLTHHKVHLANPSAEVPDFAISHGYNLVTLHRLRAREPWRLGFGAGVVIAHPESEVRGRRHDERGGLFGTGYHLAGPTVGVLASWLPARRAGPYPVAEARLTASYASVPVAGGHARVPNVALHVTIGAGWEGAR